MVSTRQVVFIGHAFHTRGWYSGGALARLNWAQFLYQFPLGVFAISLATAIFPQLSGDALDLERSGFRSVFRKGLEASLFIGLPASVGMMVVAEPAVRLLFERGRFTAHDSQLTAVSTAIYATAIWAFSMQQVLNRAFYALHDMRTPLWTTGANLVVNLVVEIPLLWTHLGESAMAVGTAVSFALQSMLMLYLLRKRVGPLGLSKSVRPMEPNGTSPISTLRPDSRSHNSDPAPMPTENIASRNVATCSSPPSTLRVKLGNCVRNVAP